MMKASVFHALTRWPSQAAAVSPSVSGMWTSGSEAAESDPPQIGWVRSPTRAATAEATRVQCRLTELWVILNRLHCALVHPAMGDVLDWCSETDSDARKTVG